MEYNVINSAKDLERHFEVLCFAAECAGTQWECQLLEQIQKLRKVNWLKRKGAPIELRLYSLFTVF